MTTETMRKALKIAQAMATAIHGNPEIEAISQSLTDPDENAWAHVYGTFFFMAPIISSCLHGDTDDGHVDAIFATLQRAVIGYRNAAPTAEALSQAMTEGRLP